MVEPLLGERPEHGLTGEPVGAVEVLAERVPFLRDAVVALMVRGIGQGPGLRSSEVRDGEIGDALENGGRLAVSRVEAEVDQAADELVVPVVPHPAVPVRGDTLRPLREEAEGLVAELAVARRRRHGRHAAQPLAENGWAVDSTPAAERASGRGPSRRLTKSVEDVVVGKPEVEVPSFPILALPRTREEAYAPVVEGLERAARRLFSFRCAPGQDVCRCGQGLEKAAPVHSAHCVSVSRLFGGGWTALISEA